MEKKKTVFSDIKSMLTRDEMKQIKGGSGNPNCNGDTGTSDWYCCRGGSATHLGTMTCNQASTQCSGGLITNDQTRC